MAYKKIFTLAVLCAALWSCGTEADNKSEQPNPKKDTKKVESLLTSAQKNTYITVDLTTDTGNLTDEEKQVLRLMIAAAECMDDIFWKQSYGDKEALLNSIADEETKQFAIANYGPWDRLDDNKPFIKGVDKKPLGAQFYPENLTKEQFEIYQGVHKDNAYTLVKKKENGQLETEFYNDAYAKEIEKAANLLDSAAAITTDTQLKYYLDLRAEALRTNRYDPSDIAWLKMDNNKLDIIIGPIENYEDQLLGIKTAFEAYVLVKDVAWSKRLEKFAGFLPALQKQLPVAAKYKQDKIGGNAQLNAYDVVYYAGDCNAGSKTIAVNLPNSEELQMQYGTRRSQLKNAMRAKYDNILVPISNILIAEEQRKHISFEAFFANTMFHEVAHGLGIKQTINNKGTVREALKEQHSALEEGKADILGLWMIVALQEMGEWNEIELMDHYVTFMTSIFRSVRFGAASAHGKANMLRFNYFQEKGAFYKKNDGTYAVEFDKMTAAMNELSALILKLQGDGNYDGVVEIMAEKGVINKDLQSDLDKLEENNIPTDIIFNQGLQLLGL